MGKPASRVRADFESLLVLAESLQRSSERHSDVYRRSRFTLLGFVLLAYAGVAAGFCLTMFGIEARSAVSHSHTLPFSVSVVLGIADVLLVLLVGYYACSLWRYSEQVKRAKLKDRKDLTEVVELLREIEPVVAKEENLSVLERFQIRIRLSRFGIGSSLQEDAGVVAKTSWEEFRARKSRADQELMKPL